jgi:two-component system NarL family response regulator
MDHSPILNTTAGAFSGTIAADGIVYRSRARVLVAGQHELIRSAIACLLERRGYEVVGQAANGTEAVALWSQLRPDVALLDLRMSGQDGIATVQAIRRVDANARAILLSGFDSDEPVHLAFRAGASGYLLKDVSADVLCQCLDAVNAGKCFVTPELAQRLATRGSPPAPTPREIEVLAGVAQGLCNKRIGRVLGIEEGTVKAHLKSILRKLDAASRTQAASIAIRRGLVEL